MPLTNAEKQRRYRERRDKDPDRRAEHLAKCRDKYKLDKEKGKRKLISDLTPREQRSQRKQWKKTKSEQRAKQKDMLKKLNKIITPPASPSENSASSSGHHSTRNKKKRVAKCYRDNAKLREELEKQRKMTNMLRMRLFRLNKTKGTDSPKSKTRKLLRHWKLNGLTRDQTKEMRENAKKTLIFQFALTEELRHKYKDLKKGKKKSIASILKGNILRKYKVISKARKIFNVEVSTPRPKKGTVASRLKSKVTDFLERDDISRMTSGIKETVTRNGVKKQKRILTTTLNKAYEKFVLENTDLKISYTTFTRLRPFWIKQAKESDRDTCACKIHENMQFIVNALQTKKLVKSSNLVEIVEEFACDITNKQCMYGNCQTCKDKQLRRNGDIDLTEEIKWFQWETKKEERQVKGESKGVTVTVKAQVVGTIDDLVDKFHIEIPRFKTHMFNITNQINHFRTLKQSLQPNEALIHIDFAENYQGKLATEIQSMHFGASKSQITLHTGVYYTQNQYQTFCSVSDCLDHNPSSVWALMDPVLDDLQKENKEINTIHFFSDGPSTQYRQKGNFYLLTKESEERNIHATWNFHEVGHGKGVPDGVGGSLKRTANELVLQGQDIIDASSFVDAISTRNTAVKLYKVCPDAVAKKAEILNSVSLKPVTGTFKVHQLKTSTKGEIYHRETSCECNGEHEGHQWQYSSLLQGEKSELNQARKRVKQDNENKPTKKTNECDIDTSADQTNENLKEAFFAKSLNILQKCESFGDVEKVCPDILKEMNSLGFNDHMRNTPKTISVIDATVDDHSNKIFPKDFPTEVTPVKIIADGNCLPGTGSMHAYGNDKQVKEMRVKIILEATINKASYLCHEYLQRGHKTACRSLPKIYAMYSDEYTPGERLTDDRVEKIYESEILKIRQDKTYMGIWQVFALSSVLMSPIFSIYPNLGNPHVRKDLHRLISPRNEQNNRIRYIMWTTTREDMRPRHWVPNHFVAAFEPTGAREPNKSDILTKLNDKSATDSNPKSENGETSKINNNGISNSSKTKHENPTDSESLAECDPSSVNPESLLGKYILVSYDGQPYPGLVLDTDDSEVYVQCMHRIGGMLDNCFYYWPKAVKDECWYNMTDVLEVIPEPTKQGKKYFVDSKILLNHVSK